MSSHLVTILDLQVEGAVWIDGTGEGVWLKNPDIYNAVLDRLIGLGYSIGLPWPARYVNGHPILAVANHPDPDGPHGFPEIVAIIQPH